MALFARRVRAPARSSGSLDQSALTQTGPLFTAISPRDRRTAFKDTCRTRDYRLATWPILATSGPKEELSYGGTQ